MADLMVNTLQSLERAPLEPGQEPNYGRIAFRDQHNVILMIGAAAFSVSLASIVPLAAGLAAELLWLGIAPRLSSFRAWVDRAQRREREARADAALEKVRSELPATHSGRFAQYSQACETLLAMLHGTLRDASDEAQKSALFRLRWSFLEHQLLAARLSRALAVAPRQTLERDIEQITVSLQGEKDWARRVTGNRALMLKKGEAQQLAELEAIGRSCELRLDSLEKSLLSWSSQADVPEAAQALPAAIDALLTQVGSAKTLEAALHQASAVNRLEA